MCARKTQEVDEHPDDPGDEALHLRAVHIDDGLRPADRRHRTLILVMERLQVFVARDQALDIARSNDAALRRDRCDRRQRTLRAVAEGGAVADGEDVAFALDLQFLVDDDASCAVTCEAELTDDRHCLDARRPNDRIRRNDPAILQDQAVLVAACDLRIEHDVDTFLLQDAHRFLLQIGRHHGQKPARRLDELDADLIGRKIVILVLHDEVDDLGQRACEFDARRATADDNEAQHTAALLLVMLDLVGAFEHMDDMIADVQRLLQGLHREGMLLDALHAEEIRRRARRENQIIVGNLAVIRDDDLALPVETAKLRHEEIDVFVMTEKRADRIGDLIGRKK